MEKIEVINTDKGEKNGVNKCPKCGSSDISYDIKRSKLVCNYCNTEFEDKKIEGIETEVDVLVGERRTSGTKDIEEGNDVITLKCSGCGADVVINTNETVNARCHWCRNNLSINEQVPNGAVPDLVLPFKLDKQEAEKRINDFVDKRRFFANKKFKKEFTTSNIMGVYFPYVLVDANCHAHFKGEGGHVARTYSIVVGKDSEGNEEKETVYDIDMYSLETDFDIAIDDLSIESSKDKLDKSNKIKTTNIINSIMPFDTENCVKYNANYLKGYTSEKRDVNIDSLEDKVNKSLLDIARHSINPELRYYDAGIRWETENLDVIGKQWVTSYLPVWLYSYQDKNKIIHYAAVNARTGETMGSIPMSKFKLFLCSLLIFLAFQIIPLSIVLSVVLKTSSIEYTIGLLPVLFFFFTIGTTVSLIYYFVKKSKYLNKKARHSYEVETKKKITNLKKNESKKNTLTEESFSIITGANNFAVKGEHTNLKAK